MRAAADRLRRRSLPALVVVCLVAGAGYLRAITYIGPTTYYIDYSTGSDTNSGTSPSTPWQHLPMMQGWSGNYTHVAGDHFIFRGGVAWPASCFPFMAPGGSSNAWDFYGATNNWYAGSAYSKPRFDLTGTPIDTMPGANVIYLGGSYNIFSDLIVSNMTWGGYGGGFGNLVINATAYGDLLVTNCDFTGISAVNGYNVERMYICVAGTSPTRTNIRFTHCTFTALPLSNAAGTAGYYVESFDHCVFHDMFSGHVGYCTNISYNTYYNINDSAAEPGAHGNACYAMVPPGGMCSIHHNQFWGLASGIECIYATLWLVRGGQTGTCYIYDNLIRDCPLGNKAIECDPEPAGAGTRGSVYIWNNTIAPATAGTMPVTVGTRTSASWAQAVVQNNQVISDHSDPVIGVDTSQGCVATIDHNLHQSTATATSLGYVSPAYAPASASSPTVGQGVDLSGYFTTDFRDLTRPSGAWDIGAYQYSGTPPGALGVIPSAQNFGVVAEGSTTNLTFTIENTGTGTLSGTASVVSPFQVVSGGTYSLAAGQTQAVVVQYSAPLTPATNTQIVTFTGDSGASATVTGIAAAAASPALASAIELDPTTGAVTAPFIISSAGYIYQTVQTGVTNGGRAAYSFTVTNAGNYTLTAQVNAPGGGENSFYLNIDAEPADPAMIWDIQPFTAGFDNRVVCWRGNGTFDNPQFPIKVFSLSAGPHQLIIRGREANTELGWITISTNQPPMPPQHLRVIPPP